MKKAELLNEIEELEPDFDTDELANNSERREKLQELREAADSDSKPKGEDTIPTAEERAKENGYPQFNGSWVIEILDDGKETADRYHCKLANGHTAHVSKDKFN